MSVDRMKSRFRDTSGVLISVHRGLWAVHPENSAPAIQAAAEWDVVEVDVRLDDTGRAFFMHDRNLLRTTGWDEPSNGAPQGMLADLRLKAGAGGEGAAQTDVGIPFLADGFDALGRSNAIFDLDVKRREDLVAVAEQTAALSASDRATLKIKVESRADIADLKTIEAAFDIMVMAKVELHSDRDLSILRALKDADQAIVELKFADFALLERACDIGGTLMRIGALTINVSHSLDLNDHRAMTTTDRVWERLAEAGVGQIMTDQPAAVKDVLSQAPFDVAGHTTAACA